MKQFVTEALEEKLDNRHFTKPRKPSWIGYFGVFGKTPRMRAETRRIQKVINAEFESLESEDKM